MTLTLLLGAMLQLPLRDQGVWRHVSFANTKTNDVAFTEKGLELDVKDSASPLFYALPEPVVVSSVSARGTVDGVPPADSDDSVFRLGLAVSGGETVSWLKRVFLPKWVKELLELAPERKFSHVEFFFVGDRARDRSKYMKETPVAALATPGAFEFSKELASPLSVFGVWLQADGDDSHSAFHLVLGEVALGISSPPPPKAFPR